MNLKISKTKPEPAIEVNVEVMERGPLEDYLASNPEAAKLHAGHLIEFREAWEAFEDGLNPLLHGIVNKAKQAWQLGKVMTDIAASLPGGKFTRDFYEQMKRELVDSQNQSIEFQTLEWSIRVFKSREQPDFDFTTAIKCRQMLLLASGEEQFKLESEKSDRGVAVTPPDSLCKIREMLDPATWEDNVDRFLADEHYCVNGEVVAPQRELLVEEWRVSFEKIDKIKKALGI